MKPEPHLQPNPPGAGAVTGALVRPPATGSGNGMGSHPQAPGDRPADGQGTGRSLRILVADDDPDCGRFFQEVLPRLGHQVFVVHTGTQLVETCRLLRPDLVLTAVRFPDRDGIAAAEEICREQPTPILLVPGEQDAGAVERALQNHYVLACLFKPVKEADLRAGIALAVRRFEKIESLRTEAADLRQALEDRKLIERAKGLAMRYTGLDEPEAFRRLRKLASDRNRKLAEVAQDIVTAAEVFQQMEGPGEVKRSGDGHARCLGRGRPHRNGSPSGLAERKGHHAGEKHV